MGGGESRKGCQPGHPTFSRGGNDSTTSSPPLIFRFFFFLKFFLSFSLNLKKKNKE